MISITTKQLSDQLGINYVEAAGVMKILVRNGQAKLVSKVYHKSGKGKPSRVYNVHNKITIKIPKAKPEPKYLIVGGRLMHSVETRTKHTPKFKKVV